MTKRPLGNGGLQGSVIGLGTWVLGGGTVWGSTPEENDSISAIHAALDAGVNLIDTAPAYGWGRSEELVGKAISDRRDQVIIATKCGLWTDDERGSFFTEFDGRIMRRSLRPDTIAIEIERSLRRLNVEHIDLYQTHWPSIPPDSTAVQDTMDCLLRFRDQGKIGFIGTCNVSSEELMENVKWGNGSVVSNQFRYSMLHREPEKSILPLCKQLGLSTLTYMSLEQGLLTGKVGMNRAFSKGEFRTNESWNPWYHLSNRQRVLDLLKHWSKYLDQYHCSIAQLVLAWTLAQSGITHVLCGARSVQQAKENALAGSLTLRADDIEQIRKDLIALGPPLLRTS